MWFICWHCYSKRVSWRTNITLLLHGRQFAFNSWLQSPTKNNNYTNRVASNTLYCSFYSHLNKSRYLRCLHYLKMLIKTTMIDLQVVVWLDSYLYYHKTVQSWPLHARSFVIYNWEGPFDRLVLFLSFSELNRFAKCVSKIKPTYDHSVKKITSACSLWWCLFFVTCRKLKRWIMDSLTRDRVHIVDHERFRC